jgi:hypothetical protein
MKFHRMFTLVTSSVLGEEFFIRRKKNCQRAVEERAESGVRGALPTPN